MLIQASLVVARLILAGVFLLAGGAKLADPHGSRRSLADFGLSAASAAVFAVLLPLLELALAVFLLPVPSAAYAAIGVLLLLLTFVAGIGVNLARGRRPDCHCFGQLSSRPIGWPLMMRNGGLAALAAFIAVAGWTNPGPSIVDWLVPLSTIQRMAVLGGALALGLLVVQAALLLAMLRQGRRLLDRLSAVGGTATQTVPATATAEVAPPPPLMVPPNAGRPVGSQAPGFSLPSVHGETLTLDAVLRRGKPAVLVFGDPDCSPCAAVLPDVGKWQREQRDVSVVLVSRGTPESNRPKVDEHGLTHVLLQREREVAEAFGVVGTPSAVLVTPDGRIGSLLAQGEVEIRQLVHQWTTPSAPGQPRPGEPAPGFMLPDLEGRPISLSQFHGRPTLAVFWNPSCVHCQRMLADLKSWEARPAGDRADLIVISMGALEDTRALGFRSTVLLDPGFSVGPLYGVTGTPSGVLIDAAGRLAAPMVVGTEHVLALAGAERSHESPRDVGALTLSGRTAPLTTFPLDAIPVRQECVDDELLPDGSIVLYNGCQRQMLTLNATAALIWDCCDGLHSVDAIVNEVLDVFPDAPNTRQDVRDLLDQFLHSGMIAPAMTSPAAQTAIPAASA